MNLIEVKAQLSFDQFRMGKYYRVDADDPRIQAQIHGGYFKATEPAPGNLAPAPLGGDTGGDLDSGVQGPKKRAPRKKTQALVDGEPDGQGDNQPDRESSVRDGQSSGPGPQDG